jgi:hypothetical protein
LSPLGSNSEANPSSMVCSSLSGNRGTRSLLIFVLTFFEAQAIAPRRDSEESHQENPQHEAGNERQYRREPHCFLSLWRALPAYLKELPRQNLGVTRRSRRPWRSSTFAFRHLAKRPTRSRPGPSPASIQSRDGGTAGDLSHRDRPRRTPVRWAAHPPCGDRISDARGLTPSRCIGARARTASENERPGSHHGIELKRIRDSPSNA